MERQVKYLLPNSKRFISPQLCEVCNGDTFYTAGHECVNCALAVMKATFDNWETIPNRPSPTLPTSPEMAAQFGISWYTTPYAVACPNGNHFRTKHITSGHCVACRGDRNDPRRLAAQADRQASYSPTFKCPTCRTRNRSTTTNKCLECHPEAAKGSTSSQFIEENPDLIILPEEARNKGLKVYRTGKPCTHGHTGYRHISGNGCIDCRKGVPRTESSVASKPYQLTDCEIFMAKTGKDHVSRSFAAGMRFSFYKTRKPCKYGHMGLRRVKGGACVDCQRGVESTLAGTRSEVFMAQHPNEMVPREFAEKAGLEVFKHGDFPLCHHDSGWRYLETNECVECAKENGTVPGLKL